MRQRQAELEAARKRHTRSAKLVERNAMAQQQLDVALDAQRALIEIQRLTGQALVTPPAAASLGDSP